MKHEMPASIFNWFQTEESDILLFIANSASVTMWIAQLQSVFALLTAFLSLVYAAGKVYHFYKTKVIRKKKVEQ